MSGETRRISLINLVILLLFTGCSTGVDLTRPLPEIASGDARIIVERRFAIPGSLQGVQVTLDGRDIFRLEAGETEYVDIPVKLLPCEYHELEASNWLMDKKLLTCLKAGETKTFLTGYNWTGGVAIGAASIPTGQFGLIEKTN